MAEALEKWPEGLFKELLPRIYEIVCEINKRFCGKLWEAYPNDWNKVSYNAVVSNGQIKMANMCLAASHHINGVSELHSDILKAQTFNDYYKMEPAKFTNVTNGITYRRWLCESNPALSKVLEEYIGDGFYQNANDLKNLEKYKGDKELLNKILAAKKENKKVLADLILKTNN